MTESPLHTSLSKEHYTPKSIVDPSRIVLEEIDLDPASCTAANLIVQARTTFEDDGGHGGLAKEWHGRVFLNPPGGKLGPDLLPLKKGNGRSSAGVWWAKLMCEWSESRVHSAIFICFSLNVFRAAMSADKTARAPFEFPFVIPRKRIQYAQLNEQGERVRGGKCQHDSAIVFVPNAPRYETDWRECEGVDRFIEQFGPLGVVRI